MPSQLQTLIDEYGAETRFWEQQANQWRLLATALYFEGPEDGVLPALHLKEAAEWTLTATETPAGDIDLEVRKVADVSS